LPKARTTTRKRQPAARCLAAAGVIAAMSVNASRADIVTIYVFNHDFSVNPPGLPVLDATINTGDTVRWLFLDSGHSATSVVGIPEVFNSGYIGVVGETFDHRFTHAGAWWYYCFPHGFDLGNGTAAGMAGIITVRAGCSANCDGSTTPPILNAADFVCFMDRFAAGDSRANCDGTPFPPLLNVNDFACFLNAFAAGCP
jgi:plastocyanin